MRVKVLFIGLITIIAMSGCTSGIATSIGGPLAGAAIEHNNEHYSE